MRVRSQIPGLLPITTRLNILAPSMLLLASCLIVLISGLPPKGSTLDYPISVLSAARVASGELPYLDFQVLYGPLQHIVLGGLIRLFRSSAPAFVANIFFVFPLILFFVLQALRMRSLRETRPWLFYALSIYSLLMSGLIGYCAFYSGWAILMCLLCLHLIEAVTRAEASLGSGLGIAALLGVTTIAVVLWRFNFGVYVAIASTACLSWGILSNARQRRVLIIAAACYFGTLVVVGGSLLSTGIGWAFAVDIADYLPRFKTREWNLVQTLRSHPHEWPVVLVFVSGLAVLGSLVVNGIRGHLSATWPYLASLLVFFIHYLYVRPDYWHAYPLICFLPTFCWCALKTNAAPAEVDDCWAGRMARGTACVALGSAVVLYVGLSANFLYSQRGFWKRTATGEPLVNVRHFVGAKDVNFLVLNQIRNELGLSGDVLWMNLPGESESPLSQGTDISFYLLDGSLPKTRVWFFDPPITSFAENQHKLVDEIESHAIRHVVIQSSIVRDRSLALRHSNPPEPSIVYDFVLRSFVNEARIDSPAANLTFQVYSRK